MSFDEPTPGLDTAPIPKYRANEKRRAAAWLIGLAVAAVVIVAIMVAVLGTSGGSSDPTPVGGPTGPAVVFSSGATTSATSAAPTSTSARPTTSASSPSGPSNRAVSCPTSAPCALPDDIGDAVGALNAYRARTHLAPVTGTVTQDAKTCAVTAASTCPSGFFWEPVGRSGKQVIDKIVGSGRGADRLLAPGLKTVQVGWAYLPSSKSFECALVIGG